ncbi:type II toxin-antitoxin system CcdA family antitoxin [Lysobacter soyae]
MRAQWLLDNREAIEAYNARVERDGTLSERVSAFLAKQGA